MWDYILVIIGVIRVSFSLLFFQCLHFDSFSLFRSFLIFRSSEGELNQNVGYQKDDRYGPVWAFNHPFWRSKILSQVILRP